MKTAVATALIVLGAAAGTSAAATHVASSDSATLALQARAELYSGQITTAEADLAVLIGQQKPSGGYGLAAAWDAFSDGTTNPSATAYSITTSDVAGTLYDAATITGDDGYLAEAERAAEALAGPLCCMSGTSGNQALWYSTSTYDRKSVYDVTSDDGAAAGVLTLIGGYSSLVASIERRLAGSQLADGNWRYVTGQTKENDLAHEAYLATGLTQAGSPLATATLNHIWKTNFLPTGAATKTTDTLGSQGDGPARALVAFVEAGDSRAAKIAAHLMPSWAKTDRGRAWYAYAQALFAASQPAPRTTKPTN